MPCTGLKYQEGGLPGGPVVKTLHFHFRGTGSIPGWGTKILHAPWRGQKKKTKVPGGLAGLG